MNTSNFLAALGLVLFAAVIGLALVDAVSGVNTLADFAWGTK